jgi:hypothetical protein
VYYTNTPTAPLVYNPSWTLCSDGSEPTVNESNGTYRWSCPADSECNVKNEYCGDGNFDNSNEECDGTSDCTSCVCDT